ncbi:MAG: EAL domain-containing protein [Nocardioidaceae bacterium]
MRWFQSATRRRALSPSGAFQTDPQTGLMTRAEFVALATDALGRGLRPGMIVVGVERPAGVVDDRFAAEVAERCVHEVGDEGLVGRVGDLQYGVLVTELDDASTGLDLAYRLRGAVPAARNCGVASDAVIPASAGGEALLRAALLALTAAREAGDGQIEVCTREHVAADERRQAIRRDLGAAMVEEGLEVNYQPILDLRSGMVVGFEALVRWTHAEHGPVPAAQFVPLAEELGLIIKLGHVVLSTATSQVQRWSVGNATPLSIHVNISGPELIAPDFVDRVKDCLRLAHLPARQLVLEVPAGVVERHLGMARGVFTALHELGVRVAVEDVDAGGVLAAQLSLLQVSILKVDRSEMESPNDAFALARARGIKVYGKSIEDEAHRRRLLRYGCEIGQGYLFAGSLPAPEAERYLRGHLNTASALGR